MATTELYPFSTPQGVPIPLDVIKPKRSCIMFNANTIQIPAGFSYLIMAVASGADAFLRMSDSGQQVANNTWVTDVCYLPQDLPIMLAIPESVTALTVVNGSTAKVALTELTQWAGIGLAKQTTTKM